MDLTRHRSSTNGRPGGAARRTIVIPLLCIRLARSESCQCAANAHVGPRYYPDATIGAAGDGDAHYLE
jgi:hypothetical protein